MASLFDFSSKISQLTRAKDYNSALNYFKENKAAFRTEQLAGNEYLVSDMVSCLRHTGNFNAAFKFIDIYNIQIDESTKERILTAYGWLLYSSYKAENAQSSFEATNDYDEDLFDDEEADLASNYHQSKSELHKKIEDVIPLLRNHKTDFSYTVISNLFSIVVKIEKKKPAPNWRIINEFCDIFNPEEFTTDCRTIEVERKGQKKEMELASDKENWYAIKSKALMKLAKYQECFEISKKGLEAFDKLHYSNDAWFSRRIALSKKNLGNAEDTIEELRTILKKKREWFIQKELADLLFESGKTKEAFNYAIQAINNFGDLEFKVDLLYLLGKILADMDDAEKAFKHFTLSKLVRQSLDWKVPQKLHDELYKLNKPEIPLEKLNELKKELKQYWDSFKPGDQGRKNKEGDVLKGKIKSILNYNERGKNGFIDMNGSSFYYSVNADSKLIPQIEAGRDVEFKVLPAKEGKKELAKIIKIS